MGRYPEALASIERAIHDAEDKSLFWLERAKMFRACTLVRAGQNAEAGAALDEVEKYYAEHAVRFAMELNTIETCRAERGLGLGDFAGAKSRLDSLFKSMNYPAEASSPVLRTALPLAARVALARKDYAAAITYASAGADYAKKVARDPNQSADLGRALVLLATAQHQSGQSAAALETLRHAISSLSGGLGADHQEVGSARGLLADWSQGGDKTEDASAAGRKA
jgi:tetratricopeptide (TPR) repeat protein